jgi:hypothetical protein
MYFDPFDRCLYKFICRTSYIRLKSASLIKFSLNLGAYGNILR